MSAHDARFWWRLGRERAAVRFDVEKRRAVEAIEPPDEKRGAIAALKPDPRRADRIRPDGRAEAEGAGGPPVRFGALAEEIAAALVEPVEDLDDLIGLDPVERLIPGRVQFDAADRAVVTALAGAVLAISPGGADAADEAERGILGRGFFGAKLSGSD